MTFIYSHMFLQIRKLGYGPDERKVRKYALRFTVNYRRLKRKVSLTPRGP